jgi:hypothetical protein
MSILIKNMKMPKTCYDCKCLTDYGCVFVGAVGSGWGDKRSGYCPLIELPTHGRLIDGDKFYEDINESVLLTDGFKEVFNLWYDEQDSIIEAEGVE